MRYTPVTTKGYFPKFTRLEHRQLLVNRLIRLRLGTVASLTGQRALPSCHLPSLWTEVKAAFRAALGVALPSVANALRKRRLDRSRCVSMDGWSRCNYDKGHTGTHWFQKLTGTGWG